MKSVLFILSALLIFPCYGQKQTFDIINYIPPKQWKKESTESAIQFTKQDDAKGIYCIITLMKSIPGTANSKENFDAAWETVVKEMVKVSVAPEMQPPATEDGWEAQTGYAPFESDGTNGIALLVTSTGYQKMVNVLILTNTDIYEKDMTAFLESVSFTKPAANNKTTSGNTTKNNQPNTAAKNNGFAFSSTNFNDGWTSAIHDDYVLTTKGNIKVYLGFIEKFNESEYAGTGKEKRHHYWNTWVAKYFTTGEMRYNPGGALSDYSSDYIEGEVTDKQTGGKRYVAMILNIIANTGTLSVIIASAPDVAQLRQQFPKADSKYDNDLRPMYNYNKFAVGKNDLAGTWSSSGGGTMSWYSTTTGNYAGATGAATSDVFTFNSNGTYSSEHKGGYGVVGAMNTYQQKYNGASTLSNWSLSLSKRWDGKTESYEAWFEVVRGGRVMHMDAGAGKSYTLYKEK